MEQKSIFQFTIDNACEMILVFDDQGKILYANQSANKQLNDSEALQGSLITDVLQGIVVPEDGRLLFPEEMDDSEQERLIYRSNKTCFPARVKLFTYVGESIPAQFLEAALPDGLVKLHIFTAYDTSTENFLEKKASQAGQEAEEALKVKSTFVANITHELRTPVNGILGNARELMGMESDNEKLKLLHLMERGCENMNALINNILDFSKLEAGKFVLEPRAFQFRSMMEYIKQNHSRRIIEKGLDFSMKISPEIPETIIGDELRITQILNNLISNAYKFTSVGGIHVEVVKTAQSGNGIELFFMVIDSGIGIALADQDKLFKSFSQVDASISRKYGGTGLGLNICKQLVELMGGSIHVQSDIGKGTTFSFGIWVQVPKEDAADEEKKCGDENAVLGEAPMDDQLLMHKLQSLSAPQVSDKVWIYGERENKEELEKKMSKLILSVEMENWDKAEMFAETIKQLVQEAPKEIKSSALRMKMAVQKGDYRKSIEAFEQLQSML